MKKYIAVIALNKQQFDDFMYEIYPTDRKQFIYVNRPESVMGVNLSNIVRIGNYYDSQGRYDHHDLYALCQMRLR